MFMQHMIPRELFLCPRDAGSEGAVGPISIKGGRLYPHINITPLILPPPSDFQTFRHPWALREALLFFTLMGSCRPLWELIMRWPLPTRPCLKVEPEIQKVQQRLKKQNTNNRTTICNGFFVAFIAFKLKSIGSLIKVNSKWCKSGEIVSFNLSWPSKNIWPFFIFLQSLCLEGQGYAKITTKNFKLNFLFSFTVNRKEVKYKSGQI